MSKDRLGTRVESASYRRMFALAGQCSRQASRIPRGARKSDSCCAGVAQRLEQPLYKGLNRVELPAPVPHGVAAEAMPPYNGKDENRPSPGVRERLGRPMRTAGVEQVARRRKDPQST